MKITIVMLVGLSFAGSLQPQDADTLTNKSIIKMTKAKLADELIIDVIESSEVNFDLSPEATANLRSDGVSEAVIKAMRKAAGLPQAPAVFPPPLPEKEKPRAAPEPAPVPAAAAVVPLPKAAEPAIVSPKEAEKAPAPEKAQPQPLLPTKAAKASAGPIEPAAAMEALKYAAPLKSLVAFHEKEFRELTNYILQWDKQIVEQSAEVDRIAAKMKLFEAELREKKNADARAYSEEILGAIVKQALYRGGYRQAKNNLFTLGASIAKKFDTIGRGRIGALAGQYDECRQRVKSSDANPATAAAAVQMLFSRLDILGDTTKYLVPMTEMLSWHQNKINEIRALVKEYDGKVAEVTAKDAQLLKQAELVDRKLAGYDARSKASKNEIAALNKEGKAIAKQRKDLAKQMENDRDELADCLKRSIADSQSAGIQRLEDIVQNVTYLFTEQLAY